MSALLKQHIQAQVVATAILGALMFMFGSPANAETVYFNDANRGPANSLQIGPFTFSMWLGDDPLATLLGSGLGVDGGVGPVCEMNRCLYYPSGADGFSGGDVSGSGEGGIYYSVAPGWKIDSVTILPQFRVFSDSGGLLPDTLGFEFYVRRWSSSGYTWIPASQMGTPVTFPFPIGDGLPTGGGFNMQTDFGPLGYYQGYRQAHLSEAQTLQWGFSVVSIDYSPIPEPSTIALFGMGLIGALCAKQKGGRSV